MATSYLTPGVYIEEVSTGPRPLQAVGTSTAAFVGTAPDANAEKNKAVAVNNWSEFVRKFVPATSAASTPLSNAVYGFFLNGGSRCYVVNVGSGGSIAGGGSGGRKGIDVLEEIDEVAIVCAPGATDAGSYDAVLTHCEKLQDRVAVLDAPEDVSDVNQLIQVGTPAGGSSRRSRRGGGDEGESEGAGAPALKPRPSDRGFGAFYHPWIYVRDPLSSPPKYVFVAPSGHVAGIYARTDATRGVHKAPANEIVRGALDVKTRVTHQEQGVLNPEGVNCIRFFPAEGIRLWGARTLAPGASEWRYVNVRRLFNMIEESIGRGTRWVVFEPNDQSLWMAIKRDVSAFLTLLWRQGALMGATPEQAFFVKCDAETNPPAVVNAGQVITVIGIAPVKPAEFVIFQIGQGVAGPEVEEEDGKKEE